MLRCRRTCAAPAKRSARAAARRSANVFTRIMLALFGVRSVARRAGDAGRDHAAAEVVSVPSRQDFLLEPHRHRAAPGADGEEAARAQSQGRPHRRAFVDAAGSIGPAPKAPQQKASWFWFFRGIDNVLRATEPYFPASARASAPSTAPSPSSTNG